MTDFHIANHKSIVQAAPEPRGIFRNGTIKGAYLPGSLVDRDPTVARGDNGQWTYRPATPGGDGLPSVIQILCERLTGHNSDVAYEAGEIGRLYIPAPGELLYVRVSAAGTGTGDSVADGDYLIVDNASGLLIATTGTPASKPFRAAEAVTDVTAAGTLVLCEYTGH